MLNFMSHLWWLIPIGIIAIPAFFLLLGIFTGGFVTNKTDKIVGWVCVVIFVVCTVLFLAGLTRRLDNNNAQFDKRCSAVGGHSISDSRYCITGKLLFSA